MVDGRQLARSHAPRAQWGKIHDIAVARFELKWFDGAYALGELLRTEMLEIEGRRFRWKETGKT